MRACNTEYRADGWLRHRGNPVSVCNKPLVFLRNNSLMLSHLHSVSLQDCLAPSRETLQTELVTKKNRVRDTIGEPHSPVAGHGKGESLFPVKCESRKRNGNVQPNVAHACFSAGLIVLSAPPTSDGYFAYPLLSESDFHLQIYCRSHSSCSAIAAKSLPVNDCRHVCHVDIMSVMSWCHVCYILTSCPCPPSPFQSLLLLHSRSNTHILCSSLLPR